jgi:hypothetical protein
MGHIILWRSDASSLVLTEAMNFDVMQMFRPLIPNWLEVTTNETTYCNSYLIEISQKDNGLTIFLKVLSQRVYNSNLSYQ